MTNPKAEDVEFTCCVCGAVNNEKVTLRADLPTTAQRQAALNSCDVIEHILSKNMRDEKECLIANIKCIRTALGGRDETA